MAACEYCSVPSAGVKLYHHGVPCPASGEEKIRMLKSENNKLQKQLRESQFKTINEGASSDLREKKLATLLGQAKEEARQLQEALEFYADIGSNAKEATEKWEQDGYGNTARNALEIQQK